MIREIHTTTHASPTTIRYIRSHVWGLTPAQLHDLFWAARGIQVVRPGKPADARGPSVFLLMRNDQAVLAPVNNWLKRLNWSGCSFLSVRIVDRSAIEYQERISTTPSGDLQRIDRIYPQKQGQIGRVVVTTDKQIAAKWASLAPGEERWSLLKSERRNARRAVWASEGVFYDLSDSQRRDDLLTELVTQWREPGRIIPGIYQFAPGVWVHETTQMGASTRLIGPLWIGAIEDTTAHGPMIGPLALCDDHPCDPMPVVDWDALQIPAFPLVPRIQIGTSRRASKRAFDVIMSIAVLLAALPLFPFIMLIIYLEDGRPFFFAHMRQTLGGHEFPCWKFRTMVKDSEKIKASLLAQNVCDGPQFFIAKDPRLLKSGWWLRRLQLDEFPQFWNVLLGHMSIVGPRPSPDKENQFCPAWREARLSVRPGITGLWQVRRTRLPETDFQEWIRYDLEYVQHQSWKMDIWIIIQTVKKVLFG